MLGIDRQQRADSEPLRFEYAYYNNRKISSIIL